MSPQFEPGDALPAFGRVLDQARLVMYAGATWDWHRLHYDTEYVQERRLAAPLVDGQMLGALFAGQVHRHFDPRARIVSMKLRFRSMIYAGERVEITGEVFSVEEEDDCRRVVCSQTALVGFRVCATCVTAVRIPG